MRIAVVEDHVELRAELVYYLSKHGHAAFGVGSLAELEQKVRDLAPNLLLLDIGLPGEDGIEIAKRFKNEAGLSIVMLTARCEEDERVRSFEAGADTFLEKPVSFRELDAVIGRAESRKNSSCNVGAWRLLPSERLLIAPNDVQVRLTLTEACLLKELFSKPDKSASRKCLIEALGADFLEYDDRRIEVVMSRLRKKVALEAGVRAPVKSVRNIGYSLEGACYLR